MAGRLNAASLTDASDAELVIAAAAGDEAAFGALYERHVDVAWRVAQATTGRTEDAQDATSEAFSRVYAAVIGGSFDTTKAFRPYLLTAVRNAAISAHRRSGRVELSDEVEPEGAERDRGLPEERLTAGLDASYVVDAFDRLPERARTVLWLTEVEGLAPREAAEVIGLSANTTAQLAVRARSRLRQEYLQVHLGATVDEDCRWAVEHLGAYVAGTLAKTNAARVVAHVGGCESCSARVEELDDLRAKLRFAALPLLPLLRAELAKRWRGRLISSSTPSGGVGQAATSALRSAGLKVLAGAAAVGLVVGGITWQVARDHGEPTRPIETAAASATTVASVAETTTTTTPSVTTTSAAVYDLNWFVTPSGNIACLMDREGSDPADRYTRCDIRDHSWANLPAKPADCNLDWGGSLYVGSNDKPAVVGCNGDTVLYDIDDPYPKNDGYRTGVLPYGAITRVGVFECRSDTSGVECINTRTRHGFKMDRTNFSVW